MSASTAINAGDNPFRLRTVFALVIAGTLIFVALLWMIGSGMGMGSANDGGAHAEGRGLNGYAAFADLLERRGYAVRRSRSQAVFDEEGLLVLTPPAFAPAEDIENAIDRHRRSGPTLLIMPKWNAFAVSGANASGAKEGWVKLAGAGAPGWADSLAQIGPLDASVDRVPGEKAGWIGFGRTGRLPDPRAVQTVASGRIVSMVRDARGQTLAGYLDDGSAYADLTAAAGQPPERIEGSSFWPVIVVAEPDLLDNYGLADKNRALAALSLVRASVAGEDVPILFDLTLNGHGRSANLLTLAFTPPFLAATLCLLLAALVAGWRAFLRFGPATRPERAIAFGKRALIAHSAGLIRRARRLHLLAGPYTERARDRIAQALALPYADPAQTDAAIDRAIQSRSPESRTFSEAAARLRKARAPHDLIRAALDIHALERMLTR